MHDFLVTHGLLALGIMVFVDDIGLPVFPNGIALFSMAMIASSVPEVQVWHYAFVSIITAQTGNMILFWGGRHGLQKWIKKHHFSFLPSEDRLSKFKRFFSKKHGGLTIIGLALITTIRPFSALIAGSIGINSVRFFIFNFIGITLWATTITIVGYYIGEKALDIILTNGRIFVSVILVLATYWYFWSQFPWHCFPSKKKKK
jgi:membrane protein DedA with SNARE-associated domain